MGLTEANSPVLRSLLTMSQPHSLPCIYTFLGKPWRTRDAATDKGKAPKLAWSSREAASADTDTDPAHYMPDMLSLVTELIVV